MSDKETGAKSARERSKRREKFVKLAESRTINAIKSIRIIGKLGNRNAYEFDEADVQKIVRALTKEIDAFRTRMTSTSRKESVEFKL